MRVIYIDSLSKAVAPKKKAIPKAQLKKMQDGLKRYRAEMDKLREKAAKQAKITTAQYKKYLTALRSPECIAEGRTAGVKAAELAGISLAKYKAFTKAYKALRDVHKAKKGKATASSMLADDAAAEPQDQEVQLSDESQKLLEQQFDLSTILNVMQSDEFYDWYAGDFSSWLASEDNAPSADAIVSWLSQKLSA
jgi:hypothetical protein